jgi:hypothetical protein
MDVPLIGVGDGPIHCGSEEVSDTSIAGSVSYDMTDDGRHFALSGSFEVVRCAP